jgi:hypothetical protein
LFGDDSKEVFDALLVLLTEDDDQQGDSWCSGLEIIYVFRVTFPMWTSG